MKKKVLICGSTGFIGRNMALSFADNDQYEVYGAYLNSRPLDHPKIKMIKADLTDKNQVNKVICGMDIVIQAAATTSGAKDIITRPYYHVTDNTVMNALIFRACFDFKVSHLVFFSCTVMYPSSDVPLKETDFDPGAEIYPSYFGGAWMKVYNEKMCEFYSRIGSTRFTAIRHSNIYGPFDHFDLERSHVFAATVKKIMSAQDKGTITVWGKGEEERDLLYIGDLVNFVNLAVQKQQNKFELFNAGCGYSISVNDLVKKIIKISGKNINVEHDLSKPSLNTKLCLNTEKAGKILGWAPETALEDGIRKTLDWYLKNA